MATAASAQGLPPATASAVDSTFYPEHDHEMGTNALEMLLRELLRPLLARFLAHHGRPLFVGSDQFIYYQQYNSKACVAPDLYVHPGLAPNATPRMLKTWEVGPPLLALEIVSSDKAKDYLRSPRRYDEVGALELFLYDPEFLTHPEGHRWTAFRRERAGQEWKVEQTGDSAVYSEQLRCWFKEVKGPGHPLLRIADDDFGSHLFPTEQEEAERKGIEGTIEVACELLGIELGVERRSSLAKLDLGALKELLGRLRTERRWPGS